MTFMPTYLPTYLPTYMLGLTMIACSDVRQTPSYLHIQKDTATLGQHSRTTPIVPIKLSSNQPTSNFSSSPPSAELYDCMYVCMYVCICTEICTEINR